MKYKIEIYRCSPESYIVSNLGLKSFIFDKIKDDLDRLLSIENENYEMLERRYEYQEKDLPLWIQPTISFYNKRTNKFGIGFLNKVRKYFIKKNIPFIVKDDLINIRRYKIDRRIFEREYQYEAVKEFINNNGYGIFKTPTGSGKTYMAITTTQILLDNNPKLKTLYLVKNAQALKKDVPEEISTFASCQIYQTLDSRLGIEWSKDIFLMTIQTFGNLYKKYQRRQLSKELRQEFEDLRDGIDFLIVDESNGYGTTLRKKLLSKFYNANLRLFLSATPYKEDSEHNKLNILEEQKKILYTIPEEELVKEDYLSQRSVFFVNCYSPDVDDRKFGSRSAFSRWWDDYIINDKYRNYMILTISDILKKHKIKTVFLVRRIEQGNILSMMLGLPFIHGGTDMDERNRIINDFVSNKNSNFIASGIFNDSINIPDMQCFFNCAGGKDQNLQIQRKGRVIRKSKKVKKKLYIDFIDWNNRYLEDHSYNRIEAMEKTVDKKNIKTMTLNQFEDKLKKYFIN